MMSNDLVNFLSFEGGYSNGQPKQYFHVCRTRAITSFPDPEPIVPVPTSITEVKKNGALAVQVTAGVATLTVPKAIKAVEVFTLMGEKLGVDANISGTQATLTVSQGTICLAVVTMADGSKATAKLFAR